MKKHGSYNYVPANFFVSQYFLGQLENLSVALLRLAQKFELCTAEQNKKSECRIALLSLHLFVNKDKHWIIHFVYLSLVS